MSTLPPVPATNRVVVKDRFAVEGFEVVYISGDKDEKTFVEYFGRMPWLALPFTEEARM